MNNSELFTPPKLEWFSNEEKKIIRVIIRIKDPDQIKKKII